MRRSAGGMASPSAPSASTRAATPNAAHTSADDLGRRGLVERDAERVGVDDAEVDAPRRAPRPRSRRRAPGHAHGDRVEEVVVHDLDAPRRAGSRRARTRAGARATRSRAGPSAPWYDGVQAGDHREQHLRGADVARRLLAADVLLARLQREAVRGAALRVDRHADEPARQRALELVARREDTRRADRRSRAARRSAATSRPPRRRRSRPAARAA